MKYDVCFRPVPIGLHTVHMLQESVVLSVIDNDIRHELEELMRYNDGIDPWIFFCSISSLCTYKETRVPNPMSTELLGRRTV
jgi:hypothetical protein